MTDPHQQLGPYTIQRLLGRGGMADVYLAWDQAERWPVALKVLRASPDKNTRLLKRFDREAELLLKLRHPHIVQVYRAGQTPDGHAFIAMEYVAGGDLGDLMRRKPGAKLPVGEAIYLMRRVAGAMAYAHEQGIVHRDLKPSNVLLRTDTGEPVVTDLGIAALAGANRLTGTLESLGTPQYMAPEQAAGDQPSDGRADVYAIGVMLYELLTGQLPFEAENGWAILALKREQPAPPVLATRPGLPPQLAAVVNACLQRDPAARPQTAGALVAALDAFLPADAHPPAPLPVRKDAATPRGAATPTPASAGPARRATWLWAGGAALALLLLLAVIFPLLGGGGRGATATPTVSGVAQAVEPTGTRTAVPTATLPPRPGDTSPRAVAEVMTLAPTEAAATSTAAAVLAQAAGTITLTATLESATINSVDAPVAVIVAPTSTQMALMTIAIVDPPQVACPPDGNSPQYSGNRIIPFVWRADGPTTVDGSFTLFVGPYGGEWQTFADTNQLSGDVWSRPVSIGDIYQDGVSEYQWQVVYLSPGGQVSGPVTCFRITGGGGGNTQEPTEEPPTVAPPTEVPPTDVPTQDPDADGDGVLIPEDQCPNRPAGDDPDPARPGCPAP